MTKRNGHFVVVMLCMILLCCSCGTRQNGEDDEITWSKHAFLLEDEDVFFACVPDIGTYDRGSYGSGHSGGFLGGTNLANGVFSWEKAGAGYGGFTVSTPPPRSWGGELSTGQNQKWIAFTFADGKTGQQRVPEDYNAGETAGNEIVYPDRIVSEDEKYQLWMEGMKETEYAGRFCESLMFQSGQIGLTQTEDLAERDKVRFHVGWDSWLWLDVTVPEGITFQKSDKNGHWIYLELDDSMASYVGIVYDEEWTEMSYEFATYLERQDMTDESYEEAAIYGVDIVRNQGKVTRYLFSFIYRKPIYAEIQVPEDDEEMLEAALDIVRSIRFR